MKFSVVVPCHNAATTIAQTLQSIAAQTLAPHEIIVVDDSSSDDSRAQIAQFERKSGVAVRVCEANVSGAGAARNIGIERATGDWIALCDADDVWFPHHLQQAAELLRDGSDVAYMADHCLLSDAGESPLPASVAHRINESDGGKSGAQWLDVLAGGFHFGHSTVIYRRQHLEKIGAFDANFERQEDLDLWLRAVASGTWAYGARGAMAYRTDTPGSLSKNVVKSEIFYLRALLGNRALLGGTAMQTLIARSARRALSLAFVDGSRADFRVARALAWPHIAPKLRAFYALAPVARPLLRGAIRLKRRWVWRHAPQKGALHIDKTN